MASASGEIPIGDSLWKRTTGGWRLGSRKLEAGSWYKEKGPGDIPGPFSVFRLPSSVLVNARAPHDALRLPILVQNRPEGLVEIFAVAEERLAQDAFLHRANLPQGAVAATVEDRRAGLEAVRVDGVERKVDDHARAVHAPARAPERRANRESPLGRAEARLQLPHLEDPDGRVHPVGHHREAGVVACGALAVRPRDEPLEAFNRGRGRRDEARHFFGREHRQQ